MSAEVLREAARLMRERAEAATDGPWTVDDPGMGRTKEIFGPIGALPGLGRQLPVAERVFGRDAKHIASWHPTVALVVADWLDAVATRIEEIHDALPFSARLTLDSLNVTAAEQALAVARAYLGKEQP